MSHVLTRMFALFTLVSYLFVGTVAVRLFSTRDVNLSFTTEYFSILSGAKVAEAEMPQIEAPEMQFAEIKFESPKRRYTKIEKVVVKNPVELSEIAPEVKEKTVKLAKHELPFHEPITLKRIEFNGELMANLVALYREAPIEEKLLVADAAPKAEVNADEVTQDEVSTQMAKTEVAEEDAEPIFFDYQEETAVAQKDAPAEVFPQPVQKVQEPVVDKIVDNTTEEVNVADLVVFDYSSAKKDIEKKVIPTVSKMTTQKPSPEKGPKVHTPKRTAQEQNDVIPNTSEQVDPYKQKGLMAGFPQTLTIQAVGTDLQRPTPLTGFSVQFMDDYSDMVQDYGDGNAVINNMLSIPSMTRSAKVLRSGYATTYTDLILQEGDFTISLPLLTIELVNELIAPYEAEGPMGLVLVELDDDTESAALDVKTRKIINLDGNLLPTEGNDYRYALFVGVDAGNALLSYKDFQGRYSSKIIHVHSHQVTFEANHYEAKHNEVFSLFEEGLLSKEKAPLIIGASQVVPFASTKASNKIGDHSHKVNFGRGLLAGRRYLQLSHLNEPIFVGVRENKNVAVPSESFMRYVISRIDGASLGNHCVVQVNLTKPATAVEVGTESVEDTLMTYTQALDSDGKFYDTVGEKTEKILVVGESQGGERINKDGKINFKIFYADGTVQYLGSYCSTNTYLVEQL